MPFLMKQSNSILIIEDAENAILDRTASLFGKQTVANLLNLSDGLLGDATYLQIICTFNCDVQSIDPALRREGRLVLEYQFEKLKIENARRLCTHMGIPGNGKDIKQPTTLAEIYARKNNADNASTNKENNDNNLTEKIQRLFKIKNQNSNSDLFAHLYS